MRIAPLVCVLLLSACGQPKGEPYRRAVAITTGMTEQQAIAIAGSPTRTVQPDQFFCTGGARVLVYDATTVYLGGLVENIDTSIAVCVDALGMVAGRVLIDH